MLALATMSQRVSAQERYEIEVYGAQTVAPSMLMLELHSNYTFSGQPLTVGGVAPTNHALHETVEATLGVTYWSELGMYLFTSTQSGLGAQLVGAQIRPKVRVPESWGLPFGIAVSTEVGYQRPLFSRDTWTWELSPIVDKNVGRWYVAFNPTFERALRGPGVYDGFEFSPSVKLSYDFTRILTLGVEYFGSADEFGYLNFGLDPGGLVKDSLTTFQRAPSSAIARSIVGPRYATQPSSGDEDAGFKPAHQHQFFGAVDLHVSPLWEVNFGVGIGATPSTDHLLAKLVIGRQLSWGQASVQ
jgi:hypothetical protein